MGKKVIAIASSDWHIHDWENYNENYSRTNQQLRAINSIVIAANKYGVPLLFGGDLFHQKKYISNELQGFFCKIHEILTNADHGVYGIDGNHDISKPVKGAGSGGGYVSNLGELLGMTCINFKSLKIPNSNIQLHGIPYIEYNVGLFKHIDDITISKGRVNILLLHTDLPTVKDTDNREVNSHSNIPQDWLKRVSKFNLVLVGHIHQPQQIRKSHVYSIGAPYHQRITDIDSSLGYYLVYDDCSMEHVYLKGFPEFKVDTGNGRDNLNFWIDGITSNDSQPDPIRISKRKFSKLDLIDGYCKKMRVPTRLKKKLINLIMDE